MARTPRSLLSGSTCPLLMRTGSDSTVAVLFVTRKYPPARGGMEEFSHRLFTHYPAPKSLLALRRGQRWLPLWLVWSIFRAAVMRPRPTVVHLGDAMLAPLAPVFRAATGAPVAVTLHGQDLTRDFGPYQRVIKRSLRGLLRSVVAVSGYTAAEAEARLGSRPGVIHNGVDAVRFARIQRATDAKAARVALGLPPTGDLIVSVGRLVERKGVCWFAENVLPRLPAECTFVVVGDGPERKLLQSLLATDTRIRWLGQAPDDTVDALYACADLFVAPNVAIPGRPEGFGIAPAEAAAAGLPVLAADVEGLRDMAGVAGAILLPSADARAWVDAIIAGAWRVSGPRRPVRDWDDVARDYERFFASVAREFLPTTAS